MSIVSSSFLSSAEMLLLGNNILPHVKRERLAAVNRSLVVHDEFVDRLYRHAGTSRSERLRGRRPA